jgi:RNA polymerase sigma-70 factor, ECF subfamily
VPDHVIRHSDVVIDVMRSKQATKPSFAQMSDAELLAFVIERRTEAFDEVYRRYAAAIVSIVRQFTVDRVAADEAMQAAFFALWERAENLEPESHLRSWLATVARNSAIDQHRRKHLETIPLSYGSDVVLDQPGPEDCAIMNERTRDIRAALDALPNEQRRVIELAYFGGLSQSEIAMLVNEPLGTVKSRIRLAMQRLRGLVANEESYEQTLDAGA